MVRGIDDNRRQARRAAARNSLDGGDLRWCRASGQRPCWRNSTINGCRLNVAADYRYRLRCSSGLCPSNAARYCNSSGGGGSLRESRRWSDMDYRKARASRQSLLCRCFREKRHLRIGSHRPFCAAGRHLSTPNRQQRSATTFGRRYAEMDRRQSRYQRHCDSRFNDRCDRLVRTPLRIA